MIKTPLSTVIGGAFWTPGATVINGAKLSFEIVMKKLFANGEQGFWYDPNDLSTMYQDAAGTVPVTSAGQPVGLVRDKSGRNNHARQTTSASRPILRQNASTGAYYLEFDGVDDFLRTTAFALPAPFGSMHAFRSVKSAGINPIVSGGAAGYLFFNTPSNMQILGGDFIARGNPDAAYHQADLSGVFLKSNISSSLNPTGSLTAYASNESKYLARFSASGTNYGGFDYYGGIMVSKTLSATDEQALRNLFNKRLGV